MPSRPNGPGTGASVGSMLGRCDPHLSPHIIDEERSSSITIVLRQLIMNRQATSGMVLDPAGQIIVQDGAAFELARRQIAARIAGNDDSTREAARIAENSGFRTFLDEGVGERTFTQDFGDQMLVSVIVCLHANLGVVKGICSRTIVDLSQIPGRTVERSQSRPKLWDAGLMLIANDTIDLILRDEAET